MKRVAYVFPHGRKIWHYVCQRCHNVAVAGVFNPQHGCPYVACDAGPMELIEAYGREAANALSRRLAAGKEA